MKLITFVGCLISLAKLGLAQETVQKWSEWDQLQMTVQQICPVSGKPVQANAHPFKVLVGEQVAFLCCSDCKDKRIDAKYWDVVQSNIAHAQANCPIMGAPVDSSMQSVIVRGQRIFVCCPPCIPKIEASHESTLETIAANYVSYAAKLAEHDNEALYARVQDICPVTGKQLEVQQQLIKSDIDGESVFLCSQDCQEQKPNSEYWQVVQKNLAKAQGICPVMRHPVDETMTSTVVNGRRIFVCCPPCIEKIESEPDRYRGIVDAQLSKWLEENKSQHGNERQSN
ncbi:MAG TPA: hypothetical protein PKD64_08450 [Pirellulaceae bacterium]|nr:hypothetical protein [Pirellulaceae bacterium]HMO92217.1 hypothetical protein [Pirellulaceae bacterium]HMP68856.1 hypothetical protein [Pirellulaceae bacterium]